MSSKNEKRKQKAENKVGSSIFQSDLSPSIAMRIQYWCTSILDRRTSPWKVWSFMVTIPEDGQWCQNHPGECCHQYRCGECLCHEGQSKGASHLGQSTDFWPTWKIVTYTQKLSGPFPDYLNNKKALGSNFLYMDTHAYSLSLQCEEERQGMEQVQEIWGENSLCNNCLWTVIAKAIFPHINLHATIILFLSVLVLWISRFQINFSKMIKENGTNWTQWELDDQWGQGDCLLWSTESDRHSFVHDPNRGFFWFFEPTSHQTNIFPTSVHNKKTTKIAF